MKAKFRFDDGVLRSCAEEVGILISTIRNYGEWTRGYLQIGDVQYGRMMFQNGYFSIREYMLGNIIV